MIDFKAIHKTIKDHINDKGFKYLTSAMWFNFEMGMFPAAAHNNAYSIKPGSGRKSEQYEADDWNDCPWKVEFCLEGINDNYLKKMGSAYDSIKSLEGLTSSKIAEIEFVNWDLQNYDKHVILTFEIMITIND